MYNIDITNYFLEQPNFLCNFLPDWDISWHSKLKKKNNFAKTVFYRILEKCRFTRVCLWTKNPDPNLGDPKRPDPTGSRSGSATLLYILLHVSECPFILLIQPYSALRRDRLILSISDTQRMENWKEIHSNSIFFTGTSAIFVFKLFLYVCLKKGRFVCRVYLVLSTLIWICPLFNCVLAIFISLLATINYMLALNYILAQFIFSLEYS